MMRDFAGTIVLPKSATIARGKIGAIFAQLQLISTQMPDDNLKPLGKHGGRRAGAGRPKRGENRERKIQGGQQNNGSTLKSGEKNTKAHWMARLDRDGHAELAAKVRAGELSATAAAFQAGFRKRSLNQARRRRFDAAAMIG